MGDSQEEVESTVSHENEQYGGDVLCLFENTDRRMTTVCDGHRFPEFQHRGDKEAGYGTSELEAEHTTAQNSALTWNNDARNPEGDEY